MKTIGSLFRMTRWSRIVVLVIVCALSVGSVAQRSTGKKKATTTKSATKAKSGRKASSNGGALSPKYIYENMDKFPLLYEYRYTEDDIEGGVVISGKGVKVTSLNNGSDYKAEATDPHAFYIHSSWYVEGDLSVEFINKADCDKFYKYVKNNNRWPEAYKGYSDGWYYVSND